MVTRFTDMGDDPVTVARRLLGQRLVRVLNEQRLAGIIVETEAYLGAVDSAAHTFGGKRTTRNESMYLPGGHAYVYFTYGMHHCLNIVCGAKDEGVAVLIRALEPTEGLPTMFAFRPGITGEAELCSGPGKLTQALEIDRRLDGENLCTSRQLFIERLRRRAFPRSRVLQTARIGLSSDTPEAARWAAKPLRFCLKGNPCLSR